MQVRQPVYRSGKNAAWQAKRANALRTMAPHVVQATILTEQDVPVISVQAQEAFSCGTLTIAAGEGYYQVASRFAGRAYIVVEQDGSWKTSALDERTAQMLLEKVRGYLAEEVAA